MASWKIFMSPETDRSKSKQLSNKKEKSAGKKEKNDSLSINNCSNKIIKHRSNKSDYLGVESKHN